MWQSSEEGVCSSPSFIRIFRELKPKSDVFGGWYKIECGRIEGPVLDQNDNEKHPVNWVFAGVLTAFRRFGRGSTALWFHRAGRGQS